MHRSMLSTIIVDCDDLEAGVNFWKGALGAEVEYRDDTYVFLDAMPGGLAFGLQKVPEPKTAKSRVHLDIMADDVEAEVRRLESLGAHRQAQVESWWVMQDPCGNEFCVIPADDAEFLDQAASWE